MIFKLILLNNYYFYFPISILLKGLEIPMSLATAIELYVIRNVTIVAMRNINPH